MEGRINIYDMDKINDSMTRAALSGGFVGTASRRVPKLQIVTVEQLFEKKRG
jgi:hypothetical protein